MAKSYVVNGEHFKTKSALTDKVRDILYAYEFEQGLNDINLKFMNAILAMHPSADVKIGCGVSTIFVRQNPVHKRNRGFWIKRTDGTETDFSFLECLKPTDPLRKFKNACRQAISGDVFVFRVNNLDGDSVCPITGIALNVYNCHVDHSPPNTFDSIVTDFITTNSINPEHVILNSSDAEIGDSFNDTVFAENFVTFHNERAVLRLVSARANLSEIRRSC
jgi:hypothetical protein